MAEFHKKVLSNGLTILYEHRNLPVTTIVVAAKYGYGYENSLNKGISHLIEHCIFKGTKKRTNEQLAASLEKVGGYVNAFTDEEETAIYTKIPSKHFELGLDVILDMFLNPAFDDKEIKKEKKVVLEEMKMYHDSPMRSIFDIMKSLLYKPPFSISGLGTEKCLNIIKRKDLLKLHLDQYTPKNTILIVIGDVSLEDVAEKAEKYFDLYRVQGYKNIDVRFSNGNYTEKRKGIDQAHLALGFHAPPFSNKLNYAAQLANSLLAPGHSSILWREIREKRGLAYALLSILECGKNFGYHTFYVGCPKENVNQVFEIIKKEIKELQNIKQKNLSEMKEQLIGNHLLKMEDSTTVAKELLYYEIAGKAKDFYNYEENISAVKLDDVKSVMNVKDYSKALILPEK